MARTGVAAIFALFLLTRSIPVRPDMKSRVTAMIGQKGAGVAASLLSRAILALLIPAAGVASFVAIGPQRPWQRHKTPSGMLATCAEHPASEPVFIRRCG
jgi:hypothetical protein